ncbi:MAG: MmcQ/YjbR family DNA-binding protein [Pseudomonadota bacterium]
MTFRERCDAICAGFAGATLARAIDGELESWKVGGKMFACFGTTEPGVSVKCADPETASMLIEAGVARTARYFHRSWIRLDETVPEEELQVRLETSYALICKGLPKRVRDTLSEGV